MKVDEELHENSSENFNRKVPIYLLRFNCIILAYIPFSLCGQGLASGPVGFAVDGGPVVELSLKVS